ncbi:MAG: hypothetical protein ACFFCW_28935 [Candidatus Hodarchaeota archaeon]
MGISWNKIWKVVSLICTIIVATGAIFGIWAFLIRPTAKLSAVIEYSDIPWPPTIVDLAYKMDKLADEDNIRKAITDPNVNLDYENVANDFSKYLVDGLREFREFQRGLMRRYGFYDIRVTNEGEKACSGVSVKLPAGKLRDSYLVGILREDKTHELLEDCLVVSIGDLKPQECVNVLAWSLYEANELDAEKIRITHDSGVASVDVRKPVGYFGRLVDKYSSIIGFILWAGLIILAFSLFFIDWYRKQKVGAKYENDKSKRGK